LRIKTLFLFLLISLGLCSTENTSQFKLVVSSGDLKLTKEYLDNGESPNVIWDENNTPLMIAARNGNIELTKLLFFYGATNFNLRESWMNSGETALIKASKKGNTDTAIYLTRFTDVNIQTFYGWTALMFAAQNDDVELVTALIGQGAKINLTNNEGWDALMLASERGNFGTVKYLKQSGALTNYSAPDLWSSPQLLSQFLNSNLTNSSKGFFSGVVKTNKENRLLTQLNYTHGNRSLTVEIIPSIGNRIISFKIGSQEMLYQGSKPSDLFSSGGIPILYPTPNRVQNGKFTFDKKTTLMKHPANSAPALMHGIAMDCSFTPISLLVQSNEASFEAMLDFDNHHPRFNAFPYQHQLKLRYTLSADGLHIRWEVTNSGDKRMGIGVGFHPYWKVIGPPASIFIQIPVSTIQNSKGQVLSKLGGGFSNFSQERNINEGTRENIFYPIKPENSVSINYSESHFSLIQRASSEFTHLIEWIPGTNYFSLENQTCSVDAHNLYASGDETNSHLLLIDPKKSVSGWVEYTLSN
jgi:galactose mutarotase-like enzyme